MQVVRNYSKRATEKSSWDGEIGKVVLECNTTTMKLNGKPIPEASIEYLLNFSLQALQDAYAGADSLESAKGLWAKKLDAITAGTLGMRTGGGTDERTTVARSIVKGLLKTKYGKDSEAFKALTDDKLDAVFAKNEAALGPKVDAEVAARAAERARKVKLAASIELEI